MAKTLFEINPSWVEKYCKFFVIANYTITDGAKPQITFRILKNTSDVLTYQCGIKISANPVVLKDFTTIGAELFSCVFNCPKQEDKSMNRLNVIVVLKEAIWLSRLEVKN
jgi:hypothetical protein